MFPQIELINFHKGSDSFLQLGVQLPINLLLKGQSDMKKNDVKLQTKVNNDLRTEREQQYRRIIKRHRAAWLVLFIAAIAPTDYSLAHQLIWLHYIFVALFAATTISMGYWHHRLNQLLHPKNW